MTDAIAQCPVTGRPTSKQDTLGKALQLGLPVTVRLGEFGVEPGCCTMPGRPLLRVCNPPWLRQQHHGQPPLPSVAVAQRRQWHSMKSSIYAQPCS